MIIAIIFLALALTLAIVIIAGLGIQIERVKQTRDEHYYATFDLRDRMSRVVMDKAKIEELYNQALLDNTDQAQKIAALSMELDELRSAVAETQQKQPERCDHAAETGVSWSVERLPEGLTNTFRCMDFRKITDKNSAQIILQDDTCTSTENSTGLRFSVIDGERYYHAALATAYGISIGNAFRVTLDNGYVFNILHAEYKHAIDDPRKDDFGDPDVNYRGEPTTSVIEFVYDWKSAPQEVIGRGGMFIEPFTDGVDNTNGNIVKIEYLGKKWRA